MSERARKLSVLLLLYFVQGLPFGFQATALPVWLRAQGVSLQGIGLAYAVALPWMLKVAWAPLVDRWSSDALGRRRSWILPMQILLAAACGATALTAPDELVTVLLLVLGMNLFAATMDVAVDGLAIDLLARDELGYGNIAQVVGYKLGMLTGGGLLLAYSRELGWAGMFAAMGGLVAIAALVTALAPLTRGVGGRGDNPPLSQIVAALVRWARTPGAAWIIAFIVTYKLGESIADAMFKPFLFDARFSEEQIGSWVGTWGMVFSLAGSFAGGVLASNTALLRAVGVAAALRSLPVAGELWLALAGPSPAGVIAVTCAEHFFGGVLTTAMFAYMMAQVDRKIGATHYTALATLEVAGKMPAAWVSGVLAASLGYAGTFAVALVLSVAFLVLLVPVSRTTRS